jgi:ribonuclease P protein component
MLKKSHRLTRKEFDTAFKMGKRFHFPHMTVVFFPSEDFHASVVVGKKVAKTAVRRNTLRRRVYDRVRRSMQKQGIKGTFLFLLKPSYHSLPRKAADAFLLESIASVLKHT